MHLDMHLFWFPDDVCWWYFTCLCKLVFINYTEKSTILACPSFIAITLVLYTRVIVIPKALFLDLNKCFQNFWLLQVDMISVPIYHAQRYLTSVEYCQCVELISNPPLAPFQNIHRLGRCLYHGEYIWTFTICRG